MKYAQMIMGLLVGTALGGSVVAATGNPAMKGGAIDEQAVKKIVRDTIMEEPKLIMESVQKFQEDMRKQQAQGATDALKDPALRAAVYDATNAGTVGPQDSKRVVVEFFDYNCPACKAQFKMLSEVLAKDKTVRVIFHEYPIFGPQSETNSRIGLAVARLAPEKYFGFHEKMMSMQGRAAEADALKFAKELGLDVEKVKAEAAKPEVQKIITDNHALGDKLQIQGTPTLVVGDEVIPHAVPAEELTAKLK